MLWAVYQSIRFILIRSMSLVIGQTGAAKTSTEPARLQCLDASQSLGTDMLLSDCQHVTPSRCHFCTIIYFHVCTLNTAFSYTSTATALYVVLSCKSLHCCIFLQSCTARTCEVSCFYSLWVLHHGPGGTFSHFPVDGFRG